MSSKNKAYAKLIKRLVSIDKDKFCRMLAAKTNVPFDHVYAIVNLLLDEMQREFRNARSVNVVNFGKFELIQQKPKKILNINTGAHQVVERTKRLKFVLDRALSSFISKFVDME